MSVQITIIGLGQVGSSIGLALAGQKNIKRIGHDKNYETARLAQKAGAVDEVKINLPTSVRGAHAIILSIPFSEMHTTLKHISQDLQEGAVVLDTAPSKTTVAAWINQLLPEGRYYVGLSPAAGADYLHGIDLGVDSARADLFKNGLFLLNAPSGTPGEAVTLATDLVALLGAHVMFTDPLEADGLMASTHVLPQLAGAALIDSTISQPGWTEARKVAARPYATVTAALAYYDESRSLGEAALSNRENTIRALDAYMASLKELRDWIAEGDQNSLTEFLDNAVKARDRWLHERTKADWAQARQEKMDSESFGERFNQMVLGGLFSRRKKESK
jgi:prephenate dehydrogenase